MRQNELRRLSVFLTACRLALDSLRAHKLRTFLTLLGVIIGVASVVLVGSAIEGLGVYAERTTSEAFGSDSYLIARIASVGSLSRRERAEKLRYNRRIKLDDLKYLEDTTGDRIFYSPYRQRADDVKYRDHTYEGANLLGVGAELIDMREIPLVEGRFFTPEEERNRQMLAVVGDAIKTDLFLGESPVGKTIRIRGLDFRVIGAIERLGTAGGQNMDNAIYIPDGAYTRLYGPDSSIAVFGAPREGGGLSLDQALDLTRSALRVRFHTRPGKPDNFDVLTPDTIRDFVANILGMIGAVVVPITCISLVVGGIVIMNIMLVSVTERTREIGVRKSLGAKRGDILLQFLLESVFMSATGGLIGLAIGAALAAGISEGFSLPLRVTFPYVALAIFVSSAVGIVSGWYPASRAAKLDPAAALRAE